MKALLSLGLCLMILPFALAFSTYEEKSGVARIVGETPGEMTRQVVRTDLTIRNATYYTDETTDSADKWNILRDEFGSYSGNMQFPYQINGYTLSDVEQSASHFTPNELFIWEANGQLQPYTLWTFGTLFPNNQPFTPADVRSLQPSFSATNPLLVFDAPAAGLAIPKQDSFVSRLGQDSTIIAPGLFSSSAFSKAILCSLIDGKTTGELFRDARNFYYNGGSDNNHNDYIGLVLQSYFLYGNPDAKIHMTWSAAQREQIRSYCNNFNQNLETGVDYLGPAGNLSLFRKHIVYQIDDYGLVPDGNFTILNVTSAMPRLDPYSLILPLAIRTTHFPRSTMILNVTADYSDPVELSVPNLPEWDGVLAERTCDEPNASVQLEFHDEYTGTSRDVIATIVPVQVVNCSSGELILWRHFNYSIDYVPFSPVVIKNVEGPSSGRAGDRVDLSIMTLPLQHDIVNYTLAVVDSDNSHVWEGELQSDWTMVNASFFLPFREGKQDYSIEVVDGNVTLVDYPFPITSLILDPVLPIPPTTPQNPTLNLSLSSFLNTTFSLTGQYYVFRNMTLFFSGNISRNITPGFQSYPITLSGLSRQDQSYNLLIELDYLGNRRSLAASLVTNNPPLLSLNLTTDAVEGEPVVISPTAIEPDGDSVTFSLNDSLFIPTEQGFSWTPGYLDAGRYDVRVTATDGLLSSSDIIPVTVANKLWCGETAAPETLLTYNITDCRMGITLPSHSVFRCAGGGIYGRGNGTGFILAGDNITLQGCTVSNFSLGVDLNSSNSDEVRGLIITGNSLGLRVWGSSNLIWGNILANSQNVNELSNGNSWNYSIGNNWSDFVSNPGFPRTYIIDGAGDGIDYLPVWPNRPPALLPVGDYLVMENETLTIVLNASDPDTQNLSFSTDALSLLPSQPSFDPENGIFIWTPGFDDQGTYTITFNVTDGEFSESQETTIIVENVNRAVQMLPLPNFLLKENQNVTITPLAWDEDGDSLSFTTDALQVLSDAHFDNASGIVTWSAHTSDIGVHLIHINVTDGSTIASAESRITVQQDLRCGDSVLTDNILDHDLICPGTGLNLIRDNITLDCDGHSINGSGGYGIYVSRTSYNRIQNCLIDGFNVGIYLYRGGNHTVTLNTISRHYLYGVYFDESSNNVIDQNIIRGDGTSILSYSSYDVNNIITDNTITSSWAGIELGDSGITDSPLGSTIRGNTIVDGELGIGIWHISNTTIEDNTIHGTTSGITLLGGNNTLSLNSFVGNQLGLKLQRGRNNIRRNVFTNNTQYGIITYQGNNTISNNTLIYNGINAYESSLPNSWNDSTTGNEWDDFNLNPGYPDHYVIPGTGGGVDWHPAAVEYSPIPCGQTLFSDTVLRRDIVNCTDNGLTIGADGITLDCNQHLIDGMEGYSSNGVVIDGHHNITLTNCRVQEFGSGISLSDSSDIAVTNIVLSRNRLGGANAVSSHASFRNVSLDDNGQAGIMAYASSLTIDSSQFSVNKNGMQLDGGSATTITQSSFSGNDLWGIVANGSSVNITTTNVTRNAQGGILIRDGDAQNAIWANYLADNRGPGLMMQEASGSQVWSNVFTSNDINALESSGSVNDWNLSRIGNYWDDFSSNPGYPYRYEISGEGDGIDQWPNRNESIIFHCGDYLWKNTTLVNDILDCPGDGLLIAADNVTLDCNGHRITGIGIGNGVFSPAKGNLMIRNCTIAGFNTGISLQYVNKSQILGITILNSSQNGLECKGCRYDQLESINISNARSVGISIFSSNSLIIKNNNIQNSSMGLDIALSYYNNITENNVKRNRNDGIKLDDAHQNLFSLNQIMYSGGSGFIIYDSRGNTIYNNSFIDNHDYNAYEGFGSFNNSWNLSRTGNYWSDFPNNTGYPSMYIISGTGGGIDYHPIWSFPNHPPHLMPLGNRTIHENESLVFSVNATDPDNDSLLFGTDAAQRLRTAFLFDPMTGVFNWTPGLSDAGVYTVLFNVTDGNMSDHNTTVLTVINVDRPPLFDPTDNQSISEGETLSLILRANDPDNDTLYFGTDAAAALPSPFTFNSATGEFIWTPTYDDAGYYSVSFNVSDGELTDSLHLSFSVQNINWQPHILPIGDRTGYENETLIIDVDAIDEDNQTLIYGTNAGQILPSRFTFSDDIGLFIWTPGFNDAGVYNILFNVTDHELSDNETIAISIGNTNRPPVLDPPGNHTLTEGQTLTFILTAHDGDGDGLSFGTDADKVLHSSFTFNATTGFFNWTAGSSDAGDYPIRFNVTDGQGVDSAIARIVVNDRSGGSPIFTKLPITPICPLNNCRAH